MFKLHYWVQNGGDGSANVQFAESEESAEEADNEQNESGDGWGESSASSVTLDIQNGKIVRKDLVWDGQKHNTVWVPLEEV